MHNSRAVVLQGFQAGSAPRPSAPHRLERTVARGSLAAWWRLVIMTRHSRGPSGSGRSSEAAIVPPRREQPLPFC